MLKNSIAFASGLVGIFKLTVYKMLTHTVLLLCDQVLTFFLCIWEYALIEIIPFKK